MHRQGRRQFLQSSVALASLGLLTSCGMPPLPWQPSPIRRIGFLSGAAPPPASDTQLEALWQGLNELGYVEGQNLVVETRYAAGRLERLPEFAAELVRLEVELIHASSTPTALAARRATTTIPIVIATASDPVAQGLVASLAHPGGNVTGLTSIQGELMPKRVQLLKETVPSAMRLGVLINANLAATDVSYQGFLRGVESGAGTTGVELLRWAELRAPEQLDEAFALLLRERPDVLLIMSDPMIANLRAQIAELALRHALPAISDAQEATRAGMLMVYGANLTANIRRSAVYVDKLLRGANPSELPVERPTTFDFIVNLKTARALGLTIPESVLAQATEIIQ